MPILQSPELLNYNRTTEGECKSGAEIIVTEATAIRNACRFYETVPPHIHPLKSSSTASFKPLASLNSYPETSNRVQCTKNDIL